VGDLTPNFEFWVVIRRLRLWGLGGRGVISLKGKIHVKDFQSSDGTPGKPPAAQAHLEDCKEGGGTYQHKIWRNQSEGLPQPHLPLHRGEKLTKGVHQEKELLLSRINKVPARAEEGTLVRRGTSD